MTSFLVALEKAKPDFALLIIYPDHMQYFSRQSLRVVASLLLAFVKKKNYIIDIHDMSKGKTSVTCLYPTQTLFFKFIFHHSR